eukprot:4257747-Pyramimonas_sp.AAC.1
MAQEDYERVQEAIQKAPRRRGVPKKHPARGIVADQMCMRPKKKLVRQRLGLGASDNIPDMQFFEGALLAGFRMIRNLDLTPSQWHHSNGVALRKSTAHGPKGKRVVHLFRALGKSFYAGLLRVPAD